MPGLSAAEPIVTVGIVGVPLLAIAVVGLGLVASRRVRRRRARRIPRGAPRTYSPEALQRLEHPSAWVSRSDGARDQWDPPPSSS